MLTCLLTAATLCAQQPAPTGSPALSVAKIFSDHMVLQQGKPTTIHGTAPAGAQVSVSFAGTDLSAKADDTGRWTAKLPAQAVNQDAQTIAIKSGEQSVTIDDVLVGEVWMCSGQSNMGWSMQRSDGGPEAAAAANYPLLRLYRTPLSTAATAQSDLQSGEWEVSSPESAIVFSAVGFYFGKELLEHLKDTPIGLINTAWGGKPSEAFTSREALEEVDSAKALLEEWDLKQKLYDPTAAQAQYDKQMAAWQKRFDAFREAKKNGENPDPKSIGRRPATPAAPNLEPNFPSAIYNQMIKPWTGYAIAGAIWYQGESNQKRAEQYQTMFPAMITDWRAQWDCGEFPFYLVQLANFRGASVEPGTPSAWAELQNAQTLTLNKVNNTGIAIINDIGEADDIHPGNKEDVGKRLARWARAEHYGQNIGGPISGALYESHEIVDGGIRVHFTHTGDGLKSRDGGELKRFEIAGKDQKWVWADAKIEDGGKSVFISSAAVAEPAAARYAWADNPEGANLVNSAGLPTSLFRTDDWPLSTTGIESFEDSVALRAVDRLPETHERLRKQGWEILFNGKDLSGWTNPYQHGTATVKVGEIRLEADKKFFLVTEKKYSDFHLMAEIKLPAGKANSGIMFRANVQPGKVFGYQAECDGSDRRWSGGLYDEGRRGWVWPSKSGDNKEESQAYMAQPDKAGSLKRHDWNRYDIICRGDKLQIKVNGELITDIKDTIDAEGHIGIQHHGEKGAVYRFRNIYVKEL